MYPPTLSFTVVYDTDLKCNGKGQPSIVTFFCEGTTKDTLQFNSVVYEEKGKMTHTSNVCSNVCDVYKSG